MQYGVKTMQNRFKDDVVLDRKIFPEDFHASAEHYTQTYQKENPLHYHNCLEIGMCVSGSGVEFIADDIHPFYGNTLTVIQRGCIHDAHIVLKDPEDTSSEWVFVFADLDALGISFNCKKSTALNDPEMTRLFLLMFDELDQKHEGYQSVFLHLLRAFLLKLRRILPVEAVPEEYLPTNDQIVLAINYIAQNYNQDITVGELAKCCNMSVSNFRKQFKEVVGTSPLEYLNNLRISVAYHLLCTTEQPILSVSEDVGFQSLSSFNRLFKRIYGLSPRQARTGNRSGCGKF